MKKFAYLGMIAVMVLASSCESWLTIRPKNEIEKDKLYETEEGFWQALNGVYSLLGENYGVRTTSWSTWSAECLIGLWRVTTNSVEDKLQEHAYKYGSVDAKLGDVFLRFYKLVAHCNTILAYIDNVDFLPERSYNIIKGEALAMRAFIHFDLIRIWGPMPEKVDEGYTYLPYVTEVGKQAMTYYTYERYMELLQADLLLAESLLGESEPLLKYSCDELNTSSLIDEYDRLEFYYRQHHMNYYGVCALKARVALWMGDKETAAKYAGIVRDAKNTDGQAKFRLGTTADIDMVNTKENTNSLGMEHIAGHYVSQWNHMQYYGSSSDNGLYFEASKVINSLFSDGNDFRANKWVKETSDDPRYATITKYMCDNDLWVPLIRLSEVYLILMESLPLDQANVIYEEFCQAKGCAYTPMTESSRQSQILMEYYREFLGEGQIFYANKRMGIKKMLWIKENMTEGQYTLPLPSRESDLLN